MKFALIGNQNCGKTTLFNQLTGSNQHVGNFPGVTVEKKEGFIRKNKNATVVDLPGIYSLSPYTCEERVTRDFLFKETPDAIINIVDAGNIERNLYLTLQLLELGIPMVLALNMMDEIKSSGGTILVKELSEELGIHAVPISAAKNEGITELINVSLKVASEKIKPRKQDFCNDSVHVAIHSIAHLIENKAKRANMSTRFVSTKLVEGDELLESQLSLSEEEKDILGHIVDSMEKSTDLDREAALADMRYQFIEKVCKKCVRKPQNTKAHSNSIKIDKILTHKYLAIPFFLVIMLMVFWFTFSLFGGYLSDLLSIFIENGIDAINTAFINFGLNETLRSLLVNGVLTGVGNVLSFLPTIVLLFFFLSLLEDSGYMARVAFVMDKLLRKIGLSGKSFVPMLMGFGCSVPAIMATRTLSSERDKKMTIILTPFMSCSAKLPIYAVFSSAFFPNHTALIMISLYILGIIISIISGLILKTTVFKGNPIPFVMELPSYRLPSFKTIILHMYEKAKGFIKKAFSIILLCSVIIWFLQSFDYKFNPVTDSRESLLAEIGRFVAVIFAPLGFGDWRAATALITGIGAKESVISTLSVLTSAPDSVSLSTELSKIFSPASAYSFLVFSLLYTPCIATIAAIKRELASIKNTVAVIAFQTAAAYISALFIYFIINLF